MPRDIEKLELMFRKLLAVESAMASRPPVTYRLDPVAPLGTSDGADVRHEATDWAPCRFRRDRPRNALVPSVGHFNASRVPANSQAWLLVVGATDKSRFETLVEALLNVQAQKRTFRFVFVLDDSEHLEFLRNYGFTFEVVAAESYCGLTRQEQIEVLKSKWGSALCLELDRVSADELAVLH
jgi:hypothetical protein